LADDSPAAERATLTVADGFDVTLFADETDHVVKPIQIRFDARGRLWVIGSTVYPQLNAGEVPDDKVLILEDTDGDGRCDKTTVFADGLTIPTGVEVTADGTGAYVGAASQLLFFKDTDGDGIADERRVVLRGFGTGDMHQTINSFAWGPGGELWMCQGLSINSRVETPWGIVALNKAGLWRFNPRAAKLEGFFGSEREPQNPWGFVFTDFGEPIVIAGNNSSPIYPVPGLVPNRRDDLQIPLIWRNGGGRKCSGGAIVETAAWPKPWQGALIVGGYINNAVWALRLVDDGAGFALEDREQPLIRSTSQSFRPVDVKFGPDGALYICDWYNPIIGHYQASFWDKRRDKTHGRIWRVTPRGTGLTNPRRLVGVPAAAVVDQLQSEDGWTRHFAQRVLTELPDERVIPTLRNWSAGKDRSDLALNQAVGVFQSHEVVEPGLLQRLCKASDAGARAYAASVVGAWADRLANPLALLRPLVADDNPRVRLHAIVACTYVASPESIEVALTAVDRPTDQFLDYALSQAVYSLKPQWLGAFKAGRLRFDNKPARLAALVKADATPDTLQAVRRLIASDETEPAARETFLRILASVGNADDLATVVNLSDVALRTRLLPAVAEAAAVRKAKPAGDLAAISRRLLDAPDEAARVEALRVVAAWGLDQLQPDVERIARDARQSDAVRAAAIEALPAVAGASSRDTLVALCAASASTTSLRASAIGSLATIDVPAAADQAATLFSAAAPDVDIEHVWRAVLKRTDAGPALAKSLSARKPTADAAKIGLRIMSASGQRDDALAAVLQPAAGLASGPKQFSEAEIAALAKEVRAQGDPTRGAAVFLRPEMSCSACHAIGGKGGRIGPDLGNLGTAQTVEFIIGAVLMPNREVKEGYVAHQILTKQGERYQAYIVADEPGQLVIRDIAQDRQVRIRKDAIAKRMQTGSPMPPGLTDILTREEFRDLIAYLASLGKTAAVKTP
jgi:putative heme-binding domain-containing protein